MTEFDRLSMRIWYFLKGYKLKEVNYLNRDEAVAWGKKLLETLTKPPDVVPPQPRQSDAPPSFPGGSAENK